MEDEREYLTLKWGVPKSWNLRSETTRGLLKEYAALGWSSSAMMQPNTPEHREVLCRLIDALDAETVYLDWTDKDATKEEAKKYVMEYRR